SMLFTGCASGEEPAEPESKTLTLAVSAENGFGFVRPDISTQVHLSAAYWMPLYDTLLVRAPNLEIKPGIATEWSYNDDNTELTMKLREGVEFTDGTPLDAEAVKANLVAFRDGGGGESYFLAMLEEVEIIDPTTITLHLSVQEPNLLLNLTGTGGVLFSPADLASDDKAAVPAGSGPYVQDTDRTTVGSVYTYVRNPDYWNPEAYPFDELVLRPMVDVAARVNALKSGEVDGAAIPATSAAEVEASGLTLTTGVANWAGLHLVDREGALVPALADVRVRQAINMVFDRESIVEHVLNGYGTPNNQMFSVENDAYLPDESDRYPFDVDAAKELMAEAGYADGFSMTIPAIIGSHDAITPIVTQQLGLLGITTEVVPMQFGDFINEVFAQKYPMFYLTHPALNARFDIVAEVAPNALWNVFKTEDPELTALIETAKSGSLEEQHEANQKIGQFVLDNAWFAPWAQPNVVYAMNDSIEAVLSPSQVEPYLWDITPAE
ncbi:MAG TPA: ABC transporter substrate-binding protein, partial [Homoserinimonas sp.]|nr:ABC transporter substrate-binding protein [Homoserinimonas sp.]